MKIGIYVAHDDDAIIGVGGTIIKHLKSGDDVYVVIFTDGENSHRIVLGLEENPNPQEVKEKRKEEIRNAMNVLGLKKDGLFFLNQIDGNGNFWKDDADLFNKVLSLTNQEKPDIIYYHYQLDDHVDHKAVNKIVSNIVKKIKTPIQAYQFCVWGGINNPDI
ncbi:MAG: PIG-L family deacetylase, partial [Candidatus Pacebacteria bacterium]|nr:PIG-L family deacetylase [Candidatus Paceibacterota bacterium]